MLRYKTVKTSKYQQIAVENAQKIMSGEFQIGERIKSRSTLSTLFNGSPETTRKALNIVADLQIVSVKHGSGGVVLLQKLATEFVENFNTAHELNVQKEEVLYFVGGALSYQRMWHLVNSN